MKNILVLDPFPDRHVLLAVASLACMRATGKLSAEVFLWQIPNIYHRQHVVHMLGELLHATHDTEFFRFISPSCDLCSTAVAAPIEVVSLGSGFVC